MNFREFIKTDDWYNVWRRSTKHYLDYSPQCTMDSFLPAKDLGTLNWDSWDSIPKYWNSTTVLPGAIAAIAKDNDKHTDLKEDDYNPEIDEFMESLGKEKNK